MKSDFINPLMVEWDQGRRARFRRPWAARVRYETELLKEDHTWAGTPIYPAAQANATVYTGTVDMSKYNRIQFAIACGVMGASGNTLFQLQMTNNANGASNTNVAATNSGTGTSVAINNSSQGATIEARADQLVVPGNPAGSPFRYCQLAAVVGNGPATFSVVPMASEARQHPAGGTTQSNSGGDDNSIPATNRVYA